MRVRTTILIPAFGGHRGRFSGEQSLAHGRRGGPAVPFHQAPVRTLTQVAAIQRQPGTPRSQRRSAPPEGHAGNL